MTSKTQELEYSNNNNAVAGTFAGLLIGSMAGALTMLLLAPQSGKKTRTQIYDKSFELRDRATKMFEDTMDDMRLNTKKFADDGQKRITELKHQGQEMAVEQLDHMSAALEAGKAAVKGEEIAPRV